MADNHNRRNNNIVRPSTWAWFTVHLFIPLLPFLLSCLARYLSTLSISWEIFNIADLSLSFGLASVFIRHSLINSDILLPNQDKEDDIAGAAAFCLLPTFLFLSLFLLIEVLDSTTKCNNG